MNPATLAQCIGVFPHTGIHADAIPLELPRPDGKPGDPAKPVTIRILASQSNMVGMGDISGARPPFPDRSLTADPAVIPGAAPIGANSLGRPASRVPVARHGVFEAKEDHEENLVNLIRDLRSEFKAPKMAVVVATVGFHGYRITGGSWKGMWEAQMAVGDPYELNRLPARQAPRGGAGETHDRSRIQTMTGLCHVDVPTARPMPLEIIPGGGHAMTAHFTSFSRSHRPFLCRPAMRSSGMNHRKKQTLHPYPELR